MPKIVRSDKDRYRSGAETGFQPTLEPTPLKVMNAVRQDNYCGSYVTKRKRFALLLTRTQPVRKRNKVLLNHPIIWNVPQTNQHTFVEH